MGKRRGVKGRKMGKGGKRGWVKGGENTKY